MQILLTIAILFPFAAPAVALASQPSPAIPQQESRENFRAKFEQLQKIGSKDEMVRLLKANLDEGVFWIVELAEVLAVSPNERVYELIKVLRETWKAAFDTKFVAEMEAYYSLLEPNAKRERTKLRSQFDKAMDRYFKASASPVNQTEIGVLILEFESMAKTFEQIGDRYFASQCWSFYGNANDETVRQGQSDFYKACHGYGRVLALREELGLKDKLYSLTKPRYDVLKGQGYDQENKGGDPKAPPAPPEPAGPAVPAIACSMAFDLLEEWDAVERPCYSLDELYPMWNSIGLQAKGSKSQLPRLADTVFLLRDGSNQVSVDLNQDGKGDIEVPLTGNFEPVVFEIGTGEEKRTWGFWATVGIQKDTYQGFEMNLAPVDEALGLYTLPAGSVTGQLGGTPLRLFDDNMDGVYGSPALSYGMVGCTEGHFAPEMDALLVGAEKRARPWSELVEIGGVWYRLAVERNGLSLTAKVETPKTGSLKLKFKGPKPAWLVLKGEGPLANCMYDLAGSPAVTVPVGTYSLFYGEVREGKKKQTLKALVLPGTNTPTWKVEQDKETVVELGGPFGFDFKVQANDEGVTVVGNSVAIIGAAGERYERAWGCVPRPEAAFRKKGSKKGSKPEKMGIIQTQEEVSEKGWAAAWFPLDLLLPRKGEEGELEVQLTEKSNKLFGKIESEWR